MVKCCAHTHTRAAKLVVRISKQNTQVCRLIQPTWHDQCEKRKKNGNVDKTDIFG